MRDTCRRSYGRAGPPSYLRGGGVPARQRGPYISRCALARAGAGGCRACSWAFWALAEQPRAPAPERLLEKQKPRIGFPVQRFCSSVNTAYQAFLFARLAIRLILRLRCSS